MGASTGFVPISHTIISQLTGVASPTTDAGVVLRPPGNLQLDNPGMLSVGVHAVDVGLVWYDRISDYAAIYGDNIGSDIDENQPNVWSGLTTNRSVAPGWPTVAVTSFTGTQSLDVTGIAGALSHGYAIIQTGTGSDGWALVHYNSLNSGGTKQLLGVKYIAGGGNVSAGMTVSYADARAHFRGSALSRETDTDLRNGRTFSSWLTDAGGTAKEPLPFPSGNSLGSGRGQQSQTDVYPRLGGTPTGSFLTIIKIERVNGYTVFTTSAAHGLEAGRSTLPGGPSFHLGGYSAQVSTTCRTAGQNLAAGAFLTGTGVLNVIDPTYFDPGTGAAPINRVSVDTPTGTVILSYTSRTIGLGSSTLTGCQWISGAGVTAVGSVIYQGIDGIRDRDFDIYDVPSTTTFRIITATTPRAGGDATIGGGTFAFLPVNPNIGSPTTAPREGNIAWGACAVPRALSHGGYRQCIFVQNTFENGFATAYITSLDLWVSDDDMATWSVVASWENNATFDAAVQGITPWIDVNNIMGNPSVYGYSVCTPSTVAARFPAATIHDKTTWEYYNRATATWSSTIPNRVQGGMWFDTPSNAVSMTWCASKACFVFVYTQGYTIYARFAPTPVGPFSPRRRLTDVLDYGKKADGSTIQGLIYGGFIDPRSGQSPNAVDDIYYIFTMSGCYQNFQARFTVYDPGETTVAIEKHNATTFMGESAKLTSPHFTSPSLSNIRGWTRDDNPWTRVGDNAFSVPVDLTAIGTDYLKKYAKVMFSDGTAIRKGVVSSITVSSGVSTVNLFHHDDGDASEKIIHTGGTIALPGVTRTSTVIAPHYSYEENPADWPGWFSWTPTGGVAIAGFSSIPASRIHRYRVRGTSLDWYIEHFGAATSNATTYEVELPGGTVPSSISSHVQGGTNFLTTDSGASLTTPGSWQVTNGTTKIQFFKNTAAGSFANTGTKLARAIGTIELAP